MPLAAVIMHQQNVSLLTFVPLATFRTSIVDQLEEVTGHVTDQKGETVVDPENNSSGGHIANQD